MTSPEKCNLMMAMFKAALKTADPNNFMPEAITHLMPTELDGRLFVTGFGKASAAMAKAVEEHLPDGLRATMTGEVLVPDGHEEACEQITITTASHPVPDQRSMQAAMRIIAVAHGLSEDDLMLVLISGGGSSLFCLPHNAITLAEKQRIVSQLLQAGVPISEMNCVRKHLSVVKGGHLGRAAHPARSIALAISDVPGDDVSVIASGPTVADPSTAAQACEILARYQIDVPPAVRALLNSSSCETPFAGDSALAKSDVHLVATPKKSLEAAAVVAHRAGYQPVILGDALEGSSRDLASWMAKQVKQVGSGKALISGGETTVAVQGTGIGGRNAEFVHALALEGRFYALAADTDGIDGRSGSDGPVAGGYITPDTLDRATALGLRPRAMLDNNDSHSFFAVLDNQIVTGPTKTNVNDFRVVLT